MCGSSFEGRSEAEQPAKRIAVYLSEETDEIRMKARILVPLFSIVMGGWGIVFAQSGTGTVSGTVVDSDKAAIAGATVTLRNTGTGLANLTTTNSDGDYRFVNIATGTYDVSIEAANFSKYIQQGVILEVGQHAVVDTTLKLGAVQEVVTVTGNAPILNTATTEIGTWFDSGQLANLPIAADGNLLKVLLSVPGISQLGTNQAVAVNGLTFSSNGGRIRSNNFTLDGQDINDPTLSGAQVPLNNSDAIGEVQIVTNQFLAEYGRNSGSVVNIVTKSGTSQYHGSALFFYNGESLNSCSNLDKAAGFCNPRAADESHRKAPLRKESRYGFTLGGPLVFPHFRNGTDAPPRAAKTFFFGDYLKWTDRQLGSGATINGVPTVAGRTTLEKYFGNLPQVQALLAFVPPGTSNFSDINAGGYVIQVGSLTGSLPTLFDSTQGSIRIDHTFSDRNLVYFRFRASKSNGDGEQATPSGLDTQYKLDTYSAMFAWARSFSNQFSNEALLGWTRLDARYYARDLSADTIPSIEIVQLGMNGTAHTGSRTAFGLATNLPQTRKPDDYQLTDNLTYLRNHHTFKFGLDLRRREVESFFIANVRGRLQYTTLDNFLLDRAQTASINLPLRGGDVIAHYGWDEIYGYAGDEWRVHPSLTLTLGIRYEYPGDSFSSLIALNKRILKANDNNPAFSFSPRPKVDKNDLMPRIGLSWNPKARSTGVIGFLTGGNKSVIRGGYSRAYDPSYTVINANIFNSFPFVAIQNVPRSQPAFATVQLLRGGSPIIPNAPTAMLLTRTVVAEDYRMPAVDQFSLGYERELAANMVVSVGYVGTRGIGLLQTVDGNPRLPCLFGSGRAGTNTCNNTGIDPITGKLTPIVLAPRVDPAKGTILVRGNTATSSYDSLQSSFEKRFGRGISGSLHYTWSTFIDTASDVFPTSVGEVVVPMDSFNRNADRARSSLDHPHHLTANLVYELPFAHERGALLGKFLGGWQVSTLVALQSGTPFSVLNGSDPAGALAGIDSLAGNAVRPNVYTTLDVSRMSVAELHGIDQQLRRQALATAEANFRALSPGPCVPGILPGSPLNNLLFATANARITCSSTGDRSFTVDFSGVEPGQRFGTSGRNMLRSAGLQNVDFGIAKVTRLNEKVELQVRADTFNFFNHRNFGIPETQVSSANFLNQWATDGGNRRVVLGAKILF
jgi:hypothetical protein